MAFLTIAAVSMFLNVAFVSKYSVATYFLPLLSALGII